MKYEVILRLHKDQNGIFGVCNKNAVGRFDAFWDAAGVFHDVFEHYFEGEHKYFSGVNSFTTFGEMCASGHAIAYMDIGINNFQYRGGSRDYIADTTTALEDYALGYTDTTEFCISNCVVPKQILDRASLNYYLNNYRDWYERHADGESPLKKLNFRHVENCYKLGYKVANKVIGKDRDASFNTLQKFLDEWHGITKLDAEYLVIEDEDAGIQDFKFTITNKGVLKIDCVVLDMMGNEYPLNSLTSY